ncbi:MAG: hypothetical protein AB1512_01330 [Thermodesulfobacteriota bacterium]
MKIVVCLKQVCHIYARTGMDPGERFISSEDKIYRINPYDEYALELALRAKESLVEAEVTLLTLGPLIAEAELRRCLAMGAERVYRVEAQGLLDPWRKSSLLARAIGELGAQLILCGKESMDTANGQVGAFLARRLRVPFVSSIMELEVQEEKGVARVWRRAGRGVREVVSSPLPAVLSVDWIGEEPRVPTFLRKRSARSEPIHTLRYRDEAEGVRVLSRRIFPPRPRPKRVTAPDSSADAFERIGQLLAGSRGEKQGSILYGPAEEQVEEILVFLRGRRLIRGRRSQEPTKEDEGHG